MIWAFIFYIVFFKVSTNQKGIPVPSVLQQLLLSPYFSIIHLKSSQWITGIFYTNDEHTTEIKASAELKVKYIFRELIKRQGIWIIFGLISMVIPVLFKGSVSDTTNILCSCIINSLLNHSPSHVNCISLTTQIQLLLFSHYIADTRSNCVS